MMIPSSESVTSAKLLFLSVKDWIFDFATKFSDYIILRFLNG
jgi:hypothetical protein